MRANGTSDTEFEGSIYRKLSNWPMLCLDDVGVFKASDRHREKICNVLDYRKDKPTFITTNLTYDGLIENFDERVFSRICAGEQIEVTGEDMRLMRK